MNKVNYKSRIVNEIIKYKNGYEIKFNNMNGASLLDFEKAVDSLEENSKYKLDYDEVQFLSKEFLLAKYK